MHGSGPSSASVRTDSDERPIPEATKLSSSVQSLSWGVQPGRPAAMSRTPAGVIRGSRGALLRRGPGHGVCAGASAKGSCAELASSGGSVTPPTVAIQQTRKLAVLIVFWASCDRAGISDAAAATAELLRVTG